MTEKRDLAPDGGQEPGVHAGMDQLAVVHQCGRFNLVLTEKQHAWRRQRLPCNKACEQESQQLNGATEKPPHEAEADEDGGWAAAISERVARRRKNRNLEE